MTKMLCTLGIALSIALSATVRAEDVRLAHPLPDVSVSIVAAADGFQLDWMTPGGTEVSEEWCATTRCVNETLAIIGEEYTYSVEWTRV